MKKAKKPKHNLYAADSPLDQTLQAEIYVAAEKDGDEIWRNTYDTKEDAVDAGDHNGTIVATYKLVKVEKLALKRTTTTKLSPAKS